MVPLFREEQPYREVAAFRLLVIAISLLGWALVVWAGLLGRPIGRTEMGLWPALAIGLPLGLLPLLAYGRLVMTTEVYADRLRVNNGMSSRVDVAYPDIAAVVTRTDDIRGDYNQRNVGVVETTRTAYVVGSYHGVQIELKDGRFLLIGSKDPTALGAALRAAWRGTAHGEPTVVPHRSRPTARFE